MCSTAKEQVTSELSGKVAVVTGANSGIGFEVARALLRDGVHVVLACRDERRAGSALKALHSEIEGASAEVRLLDLASLSSVRRFADVVQQRFDRIDLLVNNAGVLLAPYGLTEDGFEMHYGVNHLGHFALTGLLIDGLVRTPGSRIVTVTSAAYRYGRIGFENLIQHGRWKSTRFRLYAASKLANLLFACELHRRMRGTETTSIAAHPGGVATGLGRQAADRRIYRTLLPVLERLSQSAVLGARSIMMAATSLDAHGGELFHPGGLLEMRGDPICTAPRLEEKDLRTSRRLWEASEKQTSVRFP